MRRFWAGHTRQDHPVAARPFFPFVEHRTMARVMQLEETGRKLAAMRNASL
jgi:hypothetical protein